MTAESSPDAAMRRACDSILLGDIYTAMADLTPDALNQAMNLAAGLMTIPMPESYEIVSHEESDGEHRYRVRFKTSAQDFNASAAWRLVDGAWKITEISVEGL